MKQQKKANDIRQCLAILNSHLKEAGKIGIYVSIGSENKKYDYDKAPYIKNNVFTEIEIDMHIEL